MDNRGIHGTTEIWSRTCTSTGTLLSGTGYFITTHQAPPPHRFRIHHLA